MSGNLEFDATQVEPQQPLEPWERGEYDVKIDDTEIVINNDKKIGMLKITFQGIDGKYKGRKISTHINLWVVDGSGQKMRRTDKAGEIAAGQMSAICHAVNILKPRNHEELRNNYIRIFVDIQKDNKNYNEVKGFKAMNSGQAPDATSQPSSQQAQAPAWARK